VLWPAREGDSGYFYGSGEVDEDRGTHYGDSVKRASSLVIIVKLLLVDLHDMRM